MYTPIQVARLANIHDNTVRKWAAEYADLLSTQTTGRRLFTDEDVEVFRTIAALRKSGVPPGEVAERIRSRPAAVVDGSVEEKATQAPQAPLEVLSSAPIAYIALQSRMEAIERRVDAGQRDALWSARLQGISMGLALAGFIMWILWSLVNMGT